jgi:hypothetical protein
MNLRVAEKGELDLLSKPRLPEKDYAWSYLSQNEPDEVKCTQQRLSQNKQFGVSCP